MRVLLAVAAACGLALAACASPPPPPPPPPGRPVVWTNSEGSAPAAAPAARPGGDAGPGAECREYQLTVTIAGRPQPAWGTACRQPDGSWRIVN
jgi:surface antigen